MGGFKNKWGSNFYYYITTLTLFHLVRNSIHPENASVVTCRYPHIYNFSLRKEFLETLCKCIYLGF